MHVVFVTPEVSPFAKSGELADFSASLPKYLAGLGMDVSLFMPRYRRPEIDSMVLEKVGSSLSVPVGSDNFKADIYKCEMGKFEVHFVDNPKYFLRDNIYGTGTGEFLDNDERFIFFNRAILEFLTGGSKPVDILHCNNWPTALIPVFLKTHYRNSFPLKNTASVLTLHNIAFQGSFPPETLSLTGLNWDYFNSGKLAFNGQVNFLKAGLIYADVFNTVSSTYKRAIMTAKHGFGLQDILRGKKDVFFSIRNGIDCETWNPETDPYLVSNYRPGEIEKKRNNKRDLIKEFEGSISFDVPLIGLVSYMSAPKGFDILAEAMEDLMSLDIGLVILGRGEERYEKLMKSYQKKYPKNMAVKLDMSPALIHKVAAGADLLLIPSLYEPCGLNQLYGFRYGTVPIVRNTGGLGETVKHFSKKTRKGNGFVFKEYSAASLLAAVKEALDCYHKPACWRKLIKAGPTENFSWERAAKRYLRLYHKAYQLRRRRKY
ncbi:MAG: glycogen synthase [Candidatus Aminicenantes bacterium]|nr:glycogen synthase [Candidatus Aminicenantes bacterium]